MVKRLFRDRLHKAESYRVCFASRGASDRTAALSAALEAARASFEHKWVVRASTLIEVTCCASKDSAGLRVADYFLWALQRAFTRGEDRYLAFLANSVSLVHDVDDRRGSPAGVYYTRKNPLSAAKIKRTPGIWELPQAAAHTAWSRVSSPDAKPIISALRAGESNARFGRIIQPAGARGMPGLLATRRRGWSSRRCRGCRRPGRSCGGGGCLRGWRRVWRWRFGSGCCGRRI